MAAIDRVTDLSSEAFIEMYLLKNQPVVVADTRMKMTLHGKWTPSWLAQRHGEETVQVYNDYFDLTNLMSLSEYLGEHFGQSAPRASVPYVRWYSTLRDVDFFWADDVLRDLAADWELPAFVPTTNLVLPHSPFPHELDPRVDLFPARGLFISGKGARTGLHVDPWGSDAILCQFHGRKTWGMYSPAQALHSDHADARQSAGEKFAGLNETPPTYRFELVPGESVYVPHGWLHSATTDSDSISFTWNFVHQRNANALAKWFEGRPSETDRHIVEFFLGKQRYAELCG